MIEQGLKSSNSSLSDIGLEGLSDIFWNLSVKELEQKTLEKKEGVLADTGALVVDTGEFTGRSPKDKFIVEDDVTRDKVWWGDVNQKISSAFFDKLFEKIVQYLKGKEMYVRDVRACADPAFALHLRVLTEQPWQNIFVHNMFLRFSPDEIQKLGVPDWHIISVPSFMAEGPSDGVRQKNFTVINFSKKMILIGGSAYTGEIKKSMFSALNFILPTEHGVLPMHCSANVGTEGDTAIFFGLSGTGKTTLSADPKRRLIGDDEHGWSDDKVFNFEGGCYAKCVNLSREREAQIWNAIRSGALVENTQFFEGTTTLDFDNISRTENIRVSYPINFIENALEPSFATAPKNIFFLSCDALGILPPISRLSREQAMYYFISGYTAKVAGTEMGIKEPELAFSPCFGKAFLPLPPLTYAKMLGEKLEKNPDVNVWLINTGWSGGGYGQGENSGKRTPLPYTRAILDAVFDGSILKSTFERMPILDLEIPKSVPGVPDEILNPRDTWANKDAYDQKARELVSAFAKNYEKYKK